MPPTSADVVIIGGGPAGLEAALVLVRAGQRTVVFDDPAAPRNAASHGIHNFIGAEGILPEEFREWVRAEIDQYPGVTFHEQQVTNVLSTDGQGKGYVVRGALGLEVLAPRLILAFGHRDVLPTLEGFDECWGATIIPCPFCDGYENRGRVWGVVPRTPEELAIQPKLAQHWASAVHLFLSPDLALDDAYLHELEAAGIEIHRGRITRLYETCGQVDGVMLDSGVVHEVGTLLWVPKPEPVPLARQLQHQLGLACDEHGFIQTNDTFATNLPGVWAIGDVKGWTGALSAAAAGYATAVTIVKSAHSPPVISA